MLLDTLRAFVREKLDPHLQPLWNPSIETQLQFQSTGIRIPNVRDGEPAFYDTSYHPPLSELEGLGVSGWDWEDQRSVFGTVDIDHAAGHAAGHGEKIIDDLLQRLMLVPEVEIVHSKSGKGLHARLFFPPDQLPPARTRADHQSNCERSLAWLSGKIDLDLASHADVTGGMAWIFHTNRKPDGFKLLKPSNTNLPADWDRASPAPRQEDRPEQQDHPFTAQHAKITDYLAQRGLGERDGKFFRSHTHSLLLATDELKLAGGFATLATGKDGPRDRNCWLYPDTGGSFRVYRYGKGTPEHESWWKSSGGWTTCFYGRREKSDPCLTLLDLAKGDDLFHDSTERAFVTTTIRGVTETLQVTDSRYRAKLRLAYTQQTGRVVSRDVLANAIEQIASRALLDRPEIPIGVRIAEHGDRLYVDLGDRERRIVEIANGRWSVVSAAPVRFVRPPGQLPLPLPLHGGSLDELRKFVNVDADDLPLLLAFVVGCFHPSGPFPLLQVVGEQGSAKSSLMRFVHDMVDPNLAVGKTLPRDERDLLVAAQLRWLVSFDNVSMIDRKLSNLLCMLATGAASANRKNYTDDEQCILRAKRPIIITAITDVVTSSDLLDRSMTLVLPTIPPENRRSESDLLKELRREGVRGRILGFILDGVAAAHAGHSSIQRDDMPRLADIFSWATAAEPALGIAPGSAIEAVNRQATEESKRAMENPFGSAIRELCVEGFVGTASQIVDRFPGLSLTAREVGSLVRQMAPDLRRQGCCIKDGKTNGKRILRLSMTAQAA